MPARLLAGALAILAVIQIPIIASRAELGRTHRPAPPRPTAAVMATPPETGDVRLRSRELPVPPRRRVVQLLRLPSVSEGVSLTGVPEPAQRAVRAAITALGVPYRWGGSSTSGFDCSGLTQWAWAHAGVSLPHNSAAQYAALPKVSRDELRPGDLVFFFSPISHVAIYAGNGIMIDAVTSRGRVVIQPVWWEHYVGAARPG